MKTRLVVSHLRLMHPDLCVSSGNSMGSECGWQVPATGYSGSGKVHRSPYLVLAGEALLKDSSRERWVGGGFLFLFLSFKGQLAFSFGFRFYIWKPQTHAAFRKKFLSGRSLGPLGQAV